MKKFDNFFLDNKGSKILSCDLVKNTVADIKCYWCKRVIFKSWKFYLLKIIFIEVLRVALCFDCYNKWKKGKIEI